MTSLKTVLSIAGSDPSGGAGIQADLKTFTVLGVYGTAIPTNLTVQNTMGVQASYPVASKLVGDQISCVLSDLDISHIKIGMIGTQAIAEAIVCALETFTGEIILDPVMHASDGSKLTEALGPVAKLAQIASVLTPNFTELCTLSNCIPNSVENSIEACRSLWGCFPQLRCIVCKGGHFQDGNSTVTDHLLIKNGPGDAEHFAQSHPRVASINTHGTGCTYASAFAAYHQQSGDYVDAFRKSSTFVYQLLRASAPLHTGMGRGGMIHHLHITSS